MANRYWVGGTGTWNTTTNWSASSGGTGGASVPTTADWAIFDANSGTGTITLTAAATPGIIQIRNCNPLTVTGAFAISTATGQPFYYEGGTFTFSNSTVSFPAGLVVGYLNPAASGTLTFSNTGTATFSGGGTPSPYNVGIYFNSTGANVTVANTSTCSIANIQLPAGATSGTLRMNSTGTTTFTGTITVQSPGASLSFGGGAVAGVTGLTVASTATSGSTSFTSTGAVALGAVTFTSGGANVTVSNTTTLTITSATVNGSAGTLSLTNGTTQTWSGGITFTSTGSNLTIGGTNLSGIGTISIPVGATGGTCTFQNAGTLACTNITYASTAAILIFTSAVTTITASGATAISIAGTYSNVTFNCGTLSLTGSSGVKAGPCNMSCNVAFGAALTLTSDLTTTGQVSNTAQIILNSYIITARTVNFNANVSWGTGTGTGAGPRVNVTGDTGTIVTIGASFSKTITATTGMIYLTGGGSSARSVVTATNTDANVAVTSGTFTLTAASGSLYFGATDFTGFTGTVSSATAMTVSGSLTLGSGMTFSPTGLTFTGTGTFTSNGVVLTSGTITINTPSITVTLGDNASHYNSRLNLFRGGLNLNDKYIEVASFGQYDGNIASIVTITLSGGASSSGIIYIRGTGAGSPGSSAPFFGPYIANGTTYTVTNNPTVVFEPFDANVTTLATVGVWCYSSATAILPSMVFKNSIGGLPYTASFVTGAPRVLSFTYHTNFTGTHSSSFDTITLGNLYLGANVTLGTSTTVGFTTQVPTGSTGVVTINQSLTRPIAIENVTTGTTQLATPITTTQSVTLTTGTLDLNNYALTAKSFLSSVTGTRGILFGTGGNSKIVVNGTGTVWNVVETITVSGSTRVEVDNNTSTATTISTTTTTTLSGEAQALNFYIKSGSYALTLNAGAVFKTLDFTGFTGSFVSANNPVVMGDLVIPNTVGNFNGTGTITMRGTTGTNYVNVTKVMDRPLTFDLAAGYSGKTWQLVNDIVLGALDSTNANGNVTHTAGIIDLNSKRLYCRTYSSTGTVPRVLNFNAGWLITSLGGTTAAGTNAVTISGRNFSTKLSDFANPPAGTIWCSAENDAVGYGNKIFSGGGASFTGTITNDVLTLASVTNPATSFLSIGQYIYSCPATPITSVPPSPYDSGKFLGYVTEIISGAVTGTGLDACAGAIGNQVRLSISQPSPLSTATSMRSSTLFPELLHQSHAVLTIDGNHTFAKIRSFVGYPTAMLFTAGTVNGMRDLQYGNIGSGTSFTGTLTASAASGATTIQITVASGRIWPGTVIYGHANIAPGTRITLQTTGTVVGGSASYSITPALLGAIPAGTAIYAQNDCTIDSANTAGGYHFLSDPSGTKTWIDFISLKNSYASGGAVWYAGASCNDNGNNVNWFLSRPTANFHFFT